MSFIYLNLLLIFVSALTNFSSALRYPNHSPASVSEYKPIPPPKPPPGDKQLFHKPLIPVILRHPETSKKPVAGNHRPSPASSRPVSFNKPQLPPARPEDPASPADNPPPPTREAYVGQPLARNTGN